MNYISTKEAAAKWSVSLREVQRLLSEGRLPGAKKYGNCWMIPANAQKPSRRRKGFHESNGSQNRQHCQIDYLTCVLLSAVYPMPNNDPDSVLDSLPDEKYQAQYAAELSYLRGDFDAVKSYYANVSSSDVTYLCASNITICAAMCTRDYSLFRKIAADIKSLGERSTSKETAKAASLLHTLAAVCMNAPEMAPQWLRKGDFAAFNSDALPMLIFMRIKYLQSIGEYKAMLSAAQTARSLYMSKDSFTLVDIYLTCFCACGSYATDNIEQARDYLDKSIILCQQGGFVSPLGEYTTWVGGQLEIALKKARPEFEKAVLHHIEMTLKNWLFFHNEFARDNASLILSTKEYQLALLLKEGKTYKQAAEQLCLSVGRIRNLVSIIYEKLGISKKSQIGKYVY